MREILFRGKRKSGEWVVGNLFIPDRENTPTQICVGTNVVRITYNVFPETVGQYTGLTDKNSKEIFEGDIIRSEAGVVYGGSYSAVVEFKDGAFFGSGFLDIEPRDFENCEVVGNIHDAPGLVEGGE